MVQARHPSPLYTQVTRYGALQGSLQKEEEEEEEEATKATHDPSSMEHFQVDRLRRRDETKRDEMRQRGSHAIKYASRLEERRRKKSKKLTAKLRCLSLSRLVCNRRQ